MLADHQRCTVAGFGDRRLAKAVETLREGGREVRRHMLGDDGRRAIFRKMRKHFDQGFHAAGGRPDGDDQSRSGANPRRSSVLARAARAAAHAGARGSLDLFGQFEGRRASLAATLLVGLAK